MHPVEVYKMNTWIGQKHIHVQEMWMEAGMKGKIG